jgi:glycosyltransferase involved in cell wall biosynthesis
VLACTESFAVLPATTIDEIVVVDFGSLEPIAFSHSDSRVRVVRVDAKRWSLGEAINVGVLAAKGDVLAKTDADILISPDSQPGLAEASRAVASGHYDLLLTQARDLPSSLSLAEAIETVARNEAGMARPRPKWGQGGLPIFSRSGWARIGGYETRYTGWGEEDKDFTDRMRRSGGRVGWVPAKDVRIFHVWHPPSHIRPEMGKSVSANKELTRTDRSVFRSLVFRHSDVSALVTPHILRSNHPLVTIAISTSGRPGRDRMIKEAINSFAGQLDSEVETIVYDNGSTAEDIETLKAALSDLRWDANVRLESSDFASIPRARNEISRIARGKYICVADDDDLALPNRLVDHLAPFRENGLLHGTHGGWINFYEHQGILEKHPGKERTLATILKGTGRASLHPCCFYRTDVLRAVPYDESFQFGSDWDLAARMTALGLDIPHTGTFVTLRRYHDKNVTFTGTWNQKSNGARALSRLWSIYNPRRRDALVATAKTEDKDVRCSNDLSGLQILALIPPYVGKWRLALPFDRLQAYGAADDRPLLEQVLALVDGDIDTLGAGINLPVSFITSPIKGARRARNIARALEKLTGEWPSLFAHAELEHQLAEAKFNWAALAPGDNMLGISQRVGSLADVLEALSRLPDESLPRATLSLVSGSDDLGRAYHLVTAPLPHDPTAVRLLRLLSERTGLEFSFGRSPTKGNGNAVSGRI